MSGTNAVKNVSVKAILFYCTTSWSETVTLVILLYNVQNLLVTECSDGHVYTHTACQEVWVISAFMGLLSMYQYSYLV